MWLVDGTRLKKDLPQFQVTIRSAPAIKDAPLSLIMDDRANQLVERWAGSRCPVFVDFGGARPELPLITNDEVLWRLQYVLGTNNVVATPVSRRSFVAHFRNDGRLRGYRLPRLPARPTMRSNLGGFDRHLRRKAFEVVMEQNIRGERVDWSWSGRRRSET